jgi:hypothetical protein
VVKAAARPAEGAASSIQLPVTKVSLYKNGVGFFEHAGQVTGSQSVTIDFTTAQLNDVLQSLTAIDLNGGRIVGAGYNSTTPLEQQLKALPLGLGEDPTSIDLYNAIRGTRVEVRAGTVSATGRLLKVEVIDSGGQEIRLITVVSEGGEVRTMPLTPATSVQLLDADLHHDVTRYLELVASTRNKSLRHLTLEDNAPVGGGAGSRDLRVSYISEVPVWKSTYRILFTDSKTGTSQPVTLQGWSVVDNTTGEDWNRVQLSLIAGTPQSFIQPLSQAIYSRRPEVAIAESAQLTPQTHESGEEMGGGVRGIVTDASGATIPNATISVINTATNSRVTRSSDSGGKFNVGALTAGTYRVEVSMPGFQKLVEEGVQVSGQRMTVLNPTLQVGSVSQTVSVTAAPSVLSTESASIGEVVDNNSYSRLLTHMPRSGLVNYANAAAASITPNSTGTAFDDYFAYNLTEPITIRKNESALVPILQTKVDAERVTLWSSRQPVPLRALWITNTSSLTLDSGSFSIVENGEFGGEGLLDPIHPKEKRLLSYAVDQAVRVTAEDQRNASRVVSCIAAKGVLVLRSHQTSEVTYAIHNAAPESRAVVIEHPTRTGYVLDDGGPKPAETTAGAYRFRATAAAGETVRLHVSETFPGEAEFQLSDSNDDDFATILNETSQNPRLTAALKPVMEARRKVAETKGAAQQINGRMASLRADEERQRANVTALGSADKASRDRFVHDLNVTEDKMAAAQKELATAETAQLSAEEDLDKKVEAIQIDEKF